MPTRFDFPYNSSLRPGYVICPLTGDRCFLELMSSHPNDLLSFFWYWSRVESSLHRTDCLPEPYNNATHRAVMASVRPTHRSDTRLLAAVRPCAAIMPPPLLRSRPYSKQKSRLPNLGLLHYCHNPVTAGLNNGFDWFKLSCYGYFTTFMYNYLLCRPTNCYIVRFINAWEIRDLISSSFS